MQISVVNARDSEDTTALHEMMEANVNSSELWKRNVEKLNEMMNLI